MKTTFIRLLLIACSIGLALNISSLAAVAAQDNQVKVSEAELKASKAVESAADLNAKLAAAQDFIKKYPTSAARKHVADYIAAQVFAVSDSEQRLTLAQKALTIFTNEKEVNQIKLAMIDAYIKLSRFDEAFSEGSSVLAKNPEAIQILINLAIVGAEQAKQHNAKYVTPSRQYGAKAIELLEADKKPDDVDTALWNKYKAMLPQIYQELAIISFIQQNSADAQSKLEKAVQLNPTDPFNYALLGSITNNEYQQVADTYKTMPPGKARDDTLAKANQLIDKVIDQYAHAVALSDGKPAYQKLHAQVSEDVSTYYKYRHNGSTDGLQKLIDSYKTVGNP